MYVNKLCVEITRRCNLRCKHCLRGECENLSISKSTLEAIFRNIKYVGSLYLTGGEPFLACAELEMIADILEERKIKVDYLTFVVNSTIYNDKIEKVLKRLSRLCYYVEVQVSLDMYHFKEITNKNTPNIVSSGIKNLENVALVENFEQNTKQKKIILTFW